LKEVLINDVIVVLKRVCMHIIATEINKKCTCCYNSSFYCKHKFIKCYCKRRKW